SPSSTDIYTPSLHDALPILCLKLLVTLHDHFLKELLSHPHRASAYISSLSGCTYLFFNPLRFRRGCKGRNFILNRKFYLKFFFFCFQLISQFKPSLNSVFHGSEEPLLPCGVVQR